MMCCNRMQCCALWSNGITLSTGKWKTLSTRSLWAPLAHFEHQKVDDFEHQRLAGVGWGGIITSMFLRTHRHSNLLIFPAVAQTQALHFHHRSLWGGGERYLLCVCTILDVSLFGAQSYPLSGAQSEPPTALWWSTLVHFSHLSCVCMHPVW